ncbi:hypothetical protein BS330_11955 [Amycolatopsis keratiniphila subsp. nogabecina]|nr:hypothetical protein BS330_11955 [Amycolatopsis keratiniphila subsp. nogabecina]
MDAYQQSVTAEPGVREPGVVEPAVAEHDVDQERATEIQVDVRPEFFPILVVRVEMVGQDALGRRSYFAFLNVTPVFVVGLLLCAGIGRLVR